MQHHIVFQDSYENVQEINNIRDSFSDESFDDDSKVLVNLNKLNKSLNDDIKLDIVIVYNYWLMISIYFKNKKLDRPWEESSIQKVFISFIRIIEFCVFIQNLEFKNIFLLVENDFMCLFDHFKSLSNVKEDLPFRIEKDIKKKINYIVLDEGVYYHSIINIQPRRKDNTNLFTYYFKLNNESIPKILKFISSNGGSGSKGNSLGFYKEPLDSFNTFDNSRFSIKKLDKNNESDIEYATKSPRIDFLETLKYLRCENFKDLSSNSNYKKHLISKAISISITKNHLSTNSNKNYPNLNLLIEFLSYLEDSNNFDKKHYSLVVLSILLGIKIESLLYTSKERHSNIRFISNDNSLKISMENDIFAKEEGFSKNVKNTEVKIILSPKLLKHWNNMQIKISSSDIEKTIETILNEISKSLKKACNSFNKTINININYLSLYRNHYYNLLHKTTNIGLLFFGKLQKCDKARVCYASQKNRLFLLENWIYEFSNILKLDNNILPSIPSSDVLVSVGSPFVVKVDDFKNFLNDLQVLRNKNELLKFNCDMITIRYILSIILATRDFSKSCEFIDFSKSKSLLKIQEKAKDLTSSIRIIPITKLGMKLIELFFQLKEQYNIKANSPILLIKENDKFKKKKITKTELIKFFETIPDFKSIKNFIEHTPIRFGRHIFTTEALTYKELEAEYVDAFLNHTNFNLADQGIYSNFDNKKYIEKVKVFINEIEKIYLPTYLILGENDECINTRKC